MKVAVLGPGGVGGLVAGALDRAGTPVTVVARAVTVETIAERGLSVSSVLLGNFLVHPPATARLEQSVDVLIVATKAAGLQEALERIEAAPKLVLPLLNGLDHVAVLRERFAPKTVVAGTIRVEADRPEPGRCRSHEQVLARGYGFPLPVGACRDGAAGEHALRCWHTGASSSIQSSLIAAHAAGVSG